MGSLRMSKMRGVGPEGRIGPVSRLALLLLLVNVSLVLLCWDESIAKIKNEIE